MANERVKITLVRSVIDRSKRQKDTVKALGLGKMNSSREHVLTPQIAGMINKVNHLILVENL